MHLLLDISEIAVAIVLCCCLFFVAVVLVVAVVLLFCCCCFVAVVLAVAAFTSFAFNYSSEADVAFKRTQGHIDALIAQA